MQQKQEEGYDPDLDYEADIDGPLGPDINPEQIQHYVDLLRSRQHMALGILAGSGGAALGAVAWLGMSALTSVQVGWMAVAAGAIVGFLTRAGGRGIDLPFAIAAMVLTVVSILFGNLLSGCALVAQQAKTAGFLDVLGSLDPTLTIQIIGDSFRGVDVLFDVLGLAAAFLLGRRRIRFRHIAAMAAEPVEIHEQKAA